MIITAPSVKERNIDFYCYKHVITQTLLCVVRTHTGYLKVLYHIGHRGMKSGMLLAKYIFGMR